MAIFRVISTLHVHIINLYHVFYKFLFCVLPFLFSKCTSISKIKLISDTSYFCHNIFTAFEVKNCTTFLQKSNKSGLFALTTQHRASKSFNKVFPTFLIKTLFHHKPRVIINFLTQKLFWNDSSFPRKIFQRSSSLERDSKATEEGLSGNKSERERRRKGERENFRRIFLYFLGGRWRRTATKEKVCYKGGFKRAKKSFLFYFCVRCLHKWCQNLLIVLITQLLILCFCRIQSWRPRKTDFWSEKLCTSCFAMETYYAKIRQILTAKPDFLASSSLPLSERILFRQKNDMTKY